jgi:hypothetical protein
LPIHAPAYFAAGASKGGGRERDRPKEKGGPLVFLLFPYPPQRGRDLDSKTSKQASFITCSF